MNTTPTPPSELEFVLNHKMLTDHMLYDIKNNLTRVAHPALLTAHNTVSGTVTTAANLQMELYASDYAYKQHLHQFLQHTQQSQNISPRTLYTIPEVLDLSQRRAIDDLTSTRKTPSPSHTSNSSYSIGSPASSPPNDTTSLLYASAVTTTQQQQQTKPTPSEVSGSVYNQTALQRPPLPISLPSYVRPNLPLATSTPSRSPELTVPPSKPTSSMLNSAFDPHATRPFKAFPRDPLVVAANFAATDVLLDNPRVERYTEYRKRVLEQIRNNGVRCVTNPKMRRTTSTSSGDSNQRVGGCGASSGSSDNEEQQRNEETHTSKNDTHKVSTTTTTIISKNEEKEQTISSANIDNTFESLANNDSNNNPHDNHSTVGIMSSSSTVKDAAYYERRRKNNAAAKKSRDRRRIKEDEIAIRAAYLERQNIELLCQLETLKAQLAAKNHEVIL